MSRLERLLPYAFLLLAVAHTVPATAASHADDPSPADIATARELFRKGAKHAQHKQWRQALEAFERSMALRPSSLTRYSLAVAQERVGKLVEAMENLRQFVAEANHPSTRPYVRPAKEMLAQLEARIARVQVIIPGNPRGARVRINGAEIPSAAIGVDRIVNPGKHHIEAFIPGYAPFWREVELEEGGRHAVVVHLSLLASQNAGGAADADPNASSSTAPIVLVAAGGAVFAGGLVLGLIGYSKAKDASTSEGSDADSARSLALGGDIAMGLGLVAAGIGTYVLLADDPKPTPNAYGWTVNPWVTSCSGGLGLDARF